MQLLGFCKLISSCTLKVLLKRFQMFPVTSTAQMLPGHFISLRRNGEADNSPLDLADFQTQCETDEVWVWISGDQG